MEYSTKPFMKIGILVFGLCQYFAFSDSTKNNDIANGFSEVGEITEVVVVSPTKNTKLCHFKLGKDWYYFVLNEENDRSVLNIVTNLKFQKGKVQVSYDNNPNITLAGFKLESGKIIKSKRMVNIFIH